MIEIFKEFENRVENNNGSITVTYCHPTFPHFSGVCIYEEKNLVGQNKPIRQRVLILSECEMGDVIEFIHKKSPLTSEDLNVINLMIRDHSYQLAISN
jgi:hypothetical protein